MYFARPERMRILAASFSLKRFILVLQVRIQGVQEGGTARPDMTARQDPGIAACFFTQKARLAAQDGLVFSLITLRKGCLNKGCLPGRILQNKFQLAAILAQAQFVPFQGDGGAVR